MVTPMDQAQELARDLAAAFRKHLLEEYLPRIGKCVDQLSEEEIWRRPGETSNSVGNLLMHLAGNVRQWILSGLGGEEDHRERPFEFAASRDEAAADAKQLMARLRETVEAAARVVDGLSVDRLLAVQDFQGGRYRFTGQQAVLHVIEHFSGHAGQIYFWTKQLRSVDLRFYDL